MLALTKSKRKANDKYIKEKYSQVKLSMPNEEAKILQVYCIAAAKRAKEAGLSNKQINEAGSVAGFIRNAVKEKMAHEPMSQEELQKAEQDWIKEQEEKAEKRKKSKQETTEE